MKNGSEVFKIDKGIPIPAWKGRRKYPFADMAVGDSFHVKGVGSSLLSNAAANYKPKKFAARKDATGVRVWRTK